VNALFCATTSSTPNRHLPSSIKEAIVPVPPPTPPAADDFEISLTSQWITPTIIHTGWSTQIPVYEINTLDSSTMASLLQSFDLDLVCVACFPWKIPQRLLDIPTYGFLNVHPSLLPAYRGPAPLQWIFQDGTQESAGGVTVHWIDSGWDTGDIAAQEPVYLPADINVNEAEDLCAKTGGRLLVGVLNTLATGKIPRTLQPPGGFYRSWLG
jgi:methionyl-tRNA formyltransferase